MQKYCRYFHEGGLRLDDALEPSNGHQPSDGTGKKSIPQGVCSITQTNDGSAGGSEFAIHLAISLSNSILFQLFHDFLTTAPYEIHS